MVLVYMYTPHLTVKVYVHKLHSRVLFLCAYSLSLSHLLNHSHTHTHTHTHTEQKGKPFGSHWVVTPTQWLALGHLCATLVLWVSAGKSSWGRTSNPQEVYHDSQVVTQSPTWILNYCARHGQLGWTVGTHTYTQSETHTSLGSTSTRMSNFISNGGTG